MQYQEAARRRCRGCRFPRDRGHGVPGGRGRGRSARDVLRRLQDHPSQRRGRGLRALQDRGGDDQGLHRGPRRPGRRVGRHPRAGREAHRPRGPGADAPAAGRRHVPHRGRAGPGRAVPDARRRARRRPVVRALPRAPRAGACARRAGPDRCPGAEAHDDRERQPRAARPAPHRGGRARGVRGPVGLRDARLDPLGDRQERL